jgi:hypothetical protein
MAVSPRDVEEMARIRAILLGGEGITSEPPARVRVDETLTTSQDPTDDMANIMKMFNAGASNPRASNALNDSISRVRESASSDRRLRDALATERTDDGMKMGSWEIKVNEEGTTKYYDVVNIHTKEPIAIDLSLYESALALAKLLNFSVGINSPKIREVLDLEEKYAKVRQDAAIFRVRMKQRTEAQDFSRAAIAEDRYNEARTEALALRESIIAISKRV